MKNLKKIRQEKGLSQLQLAKLSGVSRTKISEFELGIRSPIGDDAEKIAKALGVAVDEIF